MFGYVKIWKPELKVAEYEQYQGVYCSLCKQLGRRYGLFSRLTLSYDLAFLALFHLSLKPHCAGFSKGRCSFNPSKRCLDCKDDALAFAADAAVLLTYHKLRDNIADNGFFKGLPARLLLPFAALAARKARRLCPDVAAVVADCMARQAALERDNTPSVDAAAEPTAHLLAALAAWQSPDEEADEHCRRFGYCLGRWIYLMDALDDLEEDLASGGYNPYVLSRGLRAGDQAALAETRTYAGQTLNVCRAECETAWHLLTRYRFDGIVQNILGLGMPAEQERIVHIHDRPV